MTELQQLTTALKFVLIVTDEEYLLDNDATLSEYLKTIKLMRPQNFDGVYIMGSSGREGHYPVFEVPVARQKMRAGRGLIRYDFQLSVTRGQRSGEVR